MQWNSTHAILVQERGCLAVLIVYIPTFLRGLWHFEPFPKKRVKRCGRAMLSVSAVSLRRSGGARRPRSTELMSQQKRNRNLQVSLDQSDGGWDGHSDTVWKSQWGRRGGPWTDPRGPDFKALYRGVLRSSSPVLCPVPAFSFTGTIASDDGFFF